MDSGEDRLGERGYLAHLPVIGAIKTMDIRNRLLLWVILLVLTATLLSYPVHIVCEYHPIQAPYIFENLPLFAALFCAWMLLLLVLGASKSDTSETPDWESLALACVFGLVVWGFWVVITPWGGYADDIYNQGHVKWVVEERSIAIGHKNLVYFDFPGMHLLVSALSVATGWGVATSRTFFLLANSIVFSAVLYLFLERILKNHRLALLGVLLVVAGNVVLTEKMRVFTPGAFGFTLLAGFLAVLTRSEPALSGRSMPDTLVMLTLFAVMVISYFPNSFFVPLALVGILVVQAIARDNARRPSSAAISLFAVLVLGWAAYYTSRTFDVLTGFLPRIKEQILSGEFLETALKLGASNAGGSVPPWATVTRLATWGILGLGTIAGLLNLSRIRRLGLADRVVTGALLGVIVISAIGIFGTEGGYQFVRFLMYAPLFAIPAGLLFLERGGPRRRGALYLLAVLVPVLSLPSFLSSVNTVSTDAIYLSDVAGGTFLESHSRDKGAACVVYGTCFDSAALARYYVPDAVIKRVPEMAAYESGQSAVRDEVSELLADFLEPPTGSTQQKVFMINEKSAVPYLHLANIPLDDPIWSSLNAVLSANNRTYDNGHLEMYMPG